MSDAHPSIARAATSIASPRARVWSLLLDVTTIPRILPVTEVLAPWRDGAPFAWTFTLGARTARVDGVVLRLDPERALVYEYGDPFDGVAHRVTIELANDDDRTTVTVVQERHASEASRAHAAGGWGLALANLKAIAEGRVG